MQRRHFILKTVATVTATGLVLAGCSTSASTTSTMKSGSDASGATSVGNRRAEIDANARTSLARLAKDVPGSQELLQKASGVLVFPSVIAAGLGIGGQFGEGALRVGNTFVDHYNLASLSVGLQIGAQSKALYFLFMTQEALDKFRKSEGWSAGADASVAVLRMGANGSIDVTSATGPVLAFALTNAGLMANLTVEGTKITRLKN